MNVNSYFDFLKFLQRLISNRVTVRPLSSTVVGRTRIFLKNRTGERSALERGFLKTDSMVYKNIV